MLKRFFLIVMFAGLAAVSTALAAEDNVNIFAHSRPVVDTPIRDRLGKNVRLSDFKGEFVLALFWSRDCVPCIKELKGLNTFYRKIKDSDIRLLLISTDTEWVSAAEQQRFLERFGAPDLDYYIDVKGKLASDFGIFTSPHIVLIDKRGNEIGRIRGSAEWDNPKVEAYIYRLRDKYGNE
jgi:peroxiredoxin